jgi:hypothetical protein
VDEKDHDPDSSPIFFRRLRRRALYCRQLTQSATMKGGHMRPATVSPTVDLLPRIRGEFLEMPGLRLTEPQARRLWNLDAPSCSAMLSALVESGFLFRTRDGSFMRVEQASRLMGEAAGRSQARPKITAA